MSDPHRWLKQIEFYTGIIIEMARRHTVISIHGIQYDGVVELQKARFEFFRPRPFQRLIPFGINNRVASMKPDVVIVHGFHYLSAILWLQILVGRRVKIFIQHHAEKPFLFPWNVLQRWINNRIDGYFFTAPGLVQPWIDKKLISREKVFQVMEASSVFHPIEQSVAQERTGMTGARNYLWVGRLDANKDPVTLIKAFSRFSREHEDVKLYVVYQQHDLLEPVRVLSQPNGERIILVGKIPHAELEYWFNSADFIVSTSRYEGSGIAVCEAMSCGCIPILSDIPSFRMMTADGECGLLFSPGDTDSLYVALKKSLQLNMPEEKNKTRQQFLRHLSFEAISRKMEDVISSN